MERSNIMGRKKVSGLVRRGRVWHVDKVVFGRRICQSTSFDQLEDAEKALAKIMEEARQAHIFGVRPARTFERAAAKFVLENQHKRTLTDDVSRLKGLMPWIGDVPLDRLHMGVLQPWISERQRSGVSPATINQG